MRATRKGKSTNWSLGELTLAAPALVACILIAGCEGPPSSLRPLYTSPEAQHLAQNDLLKGKWIVASPDLIAAEGDERPRSQDDFPDLAAEITSPANFSNRAYLLEFQPKVPTEDLDYSRFKFALVPIGKKTFFDAQFQESLEYGRKFGPNSQSFAKYTHWFGSVRIEPDLLRFTLPSQSLFDSYRLQPPEDSDSSTALFQDGVFTGSTKQLRETLVNDANEDEVRDSAVYFCRPDADCTLAVAEDQLKTYPKDSQVLDHAAIFFLARGDYARAIALLKRALDIPPAPGYRRSRLGLALALAGNFPEARREFAAAATSPQQPEDTCPEITWTYFIEGSFAETVQAADGCRTAKTGRSAEPILLKYFSLLRLGKRKEADKYFSAESQTFVGSDAEQILLLEFQGRLQDLFGPRDEPRIRRRFTYFHGLQAEAAGNNAITIACFKDPIFARKDSLVALAGRTELNRIKPVSPGK
jgi:tetratricopeptide (TPR) repeat protein